MSGAVVDMFGGVDSENGTYGPVGVVPGSPTPQPGSGPPGPPGPAGLSFQSLFKFNHLSGSVSTGPLGFTPKLCIYSGVAIKHIGDPLQQGGTFFTGFALGTGNLQQATSALTSDYNGELIPPALDGAVCNAIQGSVGGGNRYTSGMGFNAGSFDANLSVTAFGPDGITLTWNAGVDHHSGFLLVLG